jgi:hypothetical protein
MLTIINGLPSFVFGVKATGAVSKEDMQQVLLPGLQNLVNNYDEIYYLLVLETEVGMFTAGSWLEDMKAGIKNFTKWKKIAVVTHQAGVEKFTDIFSVMVPGESRGYKLLELEAAKEWISTKHPS